MEADNVGILVSLYVKKNNPVPGYYQRLGFRFDKDKEVYSFMVWPVPLQTVTE